MPMYLRMFRHVASSEIPFFTFYVLRLGVMTLADVCNTPLEAQPFYEP